MYIYQMLYRIYRMVSRVSASLRESCSLGVVVPEAVLAQTGVTDFDRYAVDPAREPLLDLFLD